MSQRYSLAGLVEGSRNDMRLRNTINNLYRIARQYNFERTNPATIELINSVAAFIAASLCVELDTTIKPLSLWEKEYNNDTIGWGDKTVWWLSFFSVKLIYAWYMHTAISSSNPEEMLYIGNGNSLIATEALNISHAPLWMDKYATIIALHGLLEHAKDVLGDQTQVPQLTQTCYLFLETMKNRAAVIGITNIVLSFMQLYNFVQLDGEFTTLIQSIEEYEEDEIMPTASNQIGHPSSPVYRNGFYHERETLDDVYLLIQENALYLDPRETGYEIEFGTEKDGFLLAHSYLQPQSVMDKYAMLPKFNIAIWHKRIPEHDILVRGIQMTHPLIEGLHASITTFSFTETIRHTVGEETVHCHVCINTSFVVGGKVIPLSFIIEHQYNEDIDAQPLYFDITSRRYVELYQLFVNVMILLQALFRHIDGQVTEIHEQAQKEGSPLLATYYIGLMYIRQLNKDLSEKGAMTYEDAQNIVMAFYRILGLVSPRFVKTWYADVKHRFGYDMYEQDIMYLPDEINEYMQMEYVMRINKMMIFTIEAFKKYGVSLLHEYFTDMLRYEQHSFTMNTEHIEEATREMIFFWVEAIESESDKQHGNSDVEFISLEEMLEYKHHRYGDDTNSQNKFSLN